MTRPGITVAAVTPAEYAAAGRLLCGAGVTIDLDRRVARFVALLEAGEVDPAGVLLATRGGEPVAAAAVQFLSGGSAVVIPPVSRDLPPRPRPPRGEEEGALAAHLVALLRHRSAALAYAFLDSADDDRGEPLLAHGFRAVTRITHMVRTAGLLPPPPRPAAAVRFVPAHLDPVTFGATLLATYDGTLDVPEACLDRPAADILAGYRTNQPDPPHWWLATDPAGEPAGVLLLTAVATPGVTELGYLGVVPAARGTGVGRALLRHAIHAAAGLGSPDLNLSVDERNGPALQLYRAHAFRPYQWQQVLLWRPSW